MEDQKDIQKPMKENIFRNLKWYEHLASGWPLVLIFIGGAIGGACGGLAYGINVKIFNSKLSIPLKYVFSLLVGFGVIILYLLVVAILVMMFPNLLKK